MDDLNTTMPNTGTPADDTALPNQVPPTPTPAPVSEPTPAEEPILPTEPIAEPTPIPEPTEIPPTPEPTPAPSTTGDGIPVAPAPATDVPEATSPVGE
ncbi:MAG: hypothetical protein UR93_C0004G0004 [Berkelbacteria bacterium GW2011_GWA2_35_9]|uniref:Uncharacterized protein n=1 Tax=Berkelbacteria bacterium GW2011_GWA2_35_9 TaxID=1618333 RepID=A0A0G0DJP5_9BACT|nr:MAG: hypothetical protein UR93_C0004G0004 [Berkelbacteria bacterium GW2011_GWA2_35_9]